MIGSWASAVGRIAALSAVVASLCVVPSSAAPKPVTSTEAIGWLNAQRAYNGIPAGITDVPAWDVGCAHHVAWDHMNPHAANPHIEEPGTRGYTEDGAFAGDSSVLGGTFTPGKRFPWGAENGWEMAPIHLMQMLAPALSISGFSPGCMVTIGGWERPDPPSVEIETYPANGTSFIYPAEQAAEWPFTPGQFVGLKQGTTTGPYLYVLAWGGGAGRILAASLTGPSGPVEIRTVDNGTTGTLGDVGAYMPPGGVLIPVHPLVPGGTYRAAVTFASSTGAGPPVASCVSTVANGTSCTYGPPPPAPPISKEWTFSTALNENVLRASHRVLRRRHHREISFVFETSAPSAHVVIRSPSGASLTPKVRRVYAHGGSMPLAVFEGQVSRLPPGGWTLCATSGGGTTGFIQAEKCERL